jgi:hypothetical protein
VGGGERGKREGQMRFGRGYGWFDGRGLKRGRGRGCEAVRSGKLL